MKTTTEAICNQDFIYNFDCLKELFKMKQEEVYDYLLLTLRQMYRHVDADVPTNSYLYAEGELPVMVVAHIDTVFEEQYLYNFTKDFNKAYGYGYNFFNNHAEVKEIYHDQEQGVMWSPQGLGADDRVGVFMIVSLLKAGLRPHVLFTTDEEIGSLSSLEFAKKYRNRLTVDDIHYIIELDREGESDCVFYDCYNPQFTKYVEEYGFKEAIGSFTDICNISPILGIAGVNLSVGYKNQHTELETIDLFTMLKNYDIIYTMINNSVKLNKGFAYKKKRVNKTKSIAGINFDTVIDPHLTEVKCKLCNREVSEYLYAPETGEVCIDCFKAFFL